ncbi:MAG: hypothetical protein LBU81_08620 [Methanosarcinales archaeon]|nr:hypothetical protein [Methanosarcinales archaeon]
MYRSIKTFTKKIVRFAHDFSLLGGEGGVCGKIAARFFAAAPYLDSGETEPTAADRNRKTAAEWQQTRQQIAPENK